MTFERVRDIADTPVCHVELIGANLALWGGDLASAAAAAREAVQAADVSSDPYVAWIAHVLHPLAVGYGGDVDGALIITGLARRISRKVGAPTLLAYADDLEANS